LILGGDSWHVKTQNESSYRRNLRFTSDSVPSSGGNSAIETYT